HHNDNYLLNNCFIPDWLYQLPAQTPSALPFCYNALLQQLLKINLICFATYVTWQPNPSNRNLIMFTVM
ncbi:hypothetical protein, partial [Escherichia coli]|uniref:hypothetical protein n=1 Tax=Escherichia coli TaxID=562 RepID=UPI001BAE8D93